MMAQAVAAGIMISFLFTEWVGLSPGGLIVPGYLAFYLDQPLRIVSTFGVALISYGIVLFLSRHMLIFGQRRFMTAVLAGYLVGWLVEAVLIRLTAFSPGFQVIGYIIPGLLANDMVRQGVVPTILSTLVVAIIVRLLLVTFLIQGGI